jgi:hypothetical protein
MLELPVHVGRFHAVSLRFYCHAQLVLEAEQRAEHIGVEHLGENVAYVPDSDISSQQVNQILKAGCLRAPQHLSLLREAAIRT